MDFNMDLSKIWLLVKPTVGLPLFFGSVALTSLLIHGAIMSHTTWYPAFWNGHARAAVASVATPGTLAAR